jgi:hypothetical protein
MALCQSFAMARHLFAIEQHGFQKRFGLYRLWFAMQRPQPVEQAFSHQAIGPHSRASVCAL